MQKNINSLAYIIGRKGITQEELEKWQKNSNYFNSVFTTDSNGVVQYMYPLEMNGNMKPGTKIQSDLMKQALQNRQPFISHPYLAQTGNLVLLVSAPIFDESGNYQGVVDGTLYLKSDNALKKFYTIISLKMGHLFLWWTNQERLFIIPMKEGSMNQ
ncbi:PDC sensor domain-containing protein [Niallia sp. XMNu-256]|uniref:PDC sensor domain-containing protein n=1 Tax=Niallia sp. XMNu-256 TaxID=3082444 RepID=UPI0030CB63AD